jgi:hypothetical protein
MGDIWKNHILFFSLSAYKKNLFQWKNVTISNECYIEKIMFPKTAGILEFK